MLNEEWRWFNFWTVNEVPFQKVRQYSFSHHFSQWVNTKVFGLTWFLVLLKSLAWYILVAAYGISVCSGLSKMVSLIIWLEHWIWTILSYPNSSFPYTVSCCLIFPVQINCCFHIFFTLLLLNNLSVPHFHSVATLLISGYFYFIPLSWPYSLQK